MQNRNVISLFAILFALVCLYQLSFTWIANGVEEDAKAFAQGDEVKEQLYLDSVATESVYSFIGLKEYTYNDCAAREINLGLVSKITTPKQQKARLDNSPVSKFEKSLIKSSRVQSLRLVNNLLSLFFSL